MSWQDVVSTQPIDEVDALNMDAHSLRGVWEAPVASGFAEQIARVLDDSPQKAGPHHPPWFSMGQGSGSYVEGWSLMDEFLKGLSRILETQLDQQ